MTTSWPDSRLPRTWRQQLAADSAATAQDAGPRRKDPARGSNGTSRWAAENGRQLLLVNCAPLAPRRVRGRFLKAYREDLKGLLIGFALSVGLIFSVWLLLRI